ncbi:hypothetical protein [Brachyspira sp. SAP_772]|uniref:hypothetical protein n=1 Tax=Brachyspira sp. SAP_772 TaxID=2608385 RepID=UPI0012F4CE53|nr:hypothetical protein [Brachyspira sp. SAP_772]
MEKLYYDFDEKNLNKTLEMVEKNTEENYKNFLNNVNYIGDYKTNVIRLCEDLKMIFNMYEENRINISTMVQIINIRYKKHLKYKLAMHGKVYYDTVLFFSLIKIKKCMEKKNTEDINIYEMIVYLYHSYLNKHIDTMKFDLNLIKEDDDILSRGSPSLIDHYSYRYYLDVKDEIISVLNDIDKYISDIISRIKEFDSNNNLINYITADDTLSYQISKFEKMKKVLNKYQYYSEYLKNRYHIIDEKIQYIYFWKEEYDILNNYNNTLHIKNIMAQLYYKRYKRTNDEKDKVRAKNINDEKDKVRAKNIIEDNIRKLEKYDNLTIDDIYKVFANTFVYTLFNIYTNYSEIEKAISIFTKKSMEVKMIDKNDKNIMEYLEKERLAILYIFNMMHEYPNEKLQIIMDIYTNINIKYLNRIEDKQIRLCKLGEPVQSENETYFKIIPNYDIVYKIIEDIQRMYWFYYDLCDLRKEKNYYIKLNDSLYQYLIQLFDKYIFSKSYNLEHNENIEYQICDVIIFIIDFISKFINIDDYKNKLEPLLIASLYYLNKDNTKTLIDIFNKEDFNNYKLIISLINECAKSKVLKEDTKIENKNVLIDIYEIMSNTRKELVVMRLFDYVRNADAYAHREIDEDTGEEVTDRYAKWKGENLNLKYNNKEYVLCYHFHSSNKIEKDENGDIIKDNRGKPLRRLPDKNWIAINQIRDSLAHRVNEKTSDVNEEIINAKKAREFIDKNYIAILECLFNVIKENNLLTDAQFRSDEF